jgi:hypothetical protein
MINIWFGHESEVIIINQLNLSDNELYFLINRMENVTILYPKMRYAKTILDKAEELYFERRKSMDFNAEAFIKEYNTEWGS